MRIFYRFLRFLSAITLFFFCWTYLSVWQVAALAMEKKTSIPANTIGASKAAASSGDRFETTLESIRENVSKAEEKEAKAQDSVMEIETVKAKRGEVDNLDTELQKEFAATEKKIKDSNLPGEILERHAKFVKHCNDNLAELKSNLNAIEHAKTQAQLKTALQKAKSHLEKVKAPRKHVPLDPNKLPHRTVKAKERAPRLKKKDFEKEFGPSTGGRGNVVAALSLDAVFGVLDKKLESWIKNRASVRKPFQLAYNGPASDIPLAFDSELSTKNDELRKLPGFSFSQGTNNSLESILLAQTTTNLPTAADLAETSEVQFTPEIRAKAQELGNSPVKIYNWVRNNIVYEPYYGSFKGAAQTLAEGAGNDFDQASLLIALLRVSNIAAKYSYGTIEIPAEKAMNWVGGVSDPRIAATILATQGIPVKLMLAGGTVKAIQLEHVWVDVWVDYFPSWGARHKLGGEDTWISLDPSFKQSSFKQGMDMYGLMGFNADQFLQEYITDVRDITAYQDYSMRMINFIDANYPDSDVEDILGASEITLTETINKQEFPYLLGTLPYKIIATASEFSQIPHSKNYSITIEIASNSLEGNLGYSGALNDLAAKRLTLSYDPASASDETLIQQYGGDVYAVPPYLLNLKPVLRINGSPVATGGSITMGNEQTVVISFAGPDGDSDRIENVVTAGEYYAIIFQSQDTPVTAPSGNMAKLIENSKIADTPEISIDDLLGQLLYSIGVSYFHTLSFENELFAKTLQLVRMRQPAEAMVSQRIKVNYFFGLPRSVSVGGFNIDVDRNVNVVVSPTQDDERVRAFMILSGLASSISENRILEAFFEISSVSSVRLLKHASGLGIPVYTITNANLNETLPLLQVGEAVKADVVNSVNAGKKVIIPKMNMTLDQWTGVGYIVIDEVTGAASYMISGGLAGASTPNKAPIANPNFKATWLDRLIFKIVRWNIISFAKDQIGTLYKLGCKDPTAAGICKDRIDCSGLAALSYDKAGITLLKNKNAAMQYAYALQIDYPIYADLVFFKGSYDKNCDGIVDADDGITHVAIYERPDYMIGAQSKGVKEYPISGWTERRPLVCYEFVCKQKQNNVCVAWDTCACVKGQWKTNPTGSLYNPFVGYGQIVP